MADMKMFLSILDFKILEVKILFNLCSNFICIEFVYLMVNKDNRCLNNKICTTNIQLFLNKKCNREKQNNS